MTKILLNFDIEEFDLPLEYNLNISEKEQFESSFKGLQKILLLLEKYDIQATFFVTANFAQKYPQIIKKVSKKHEIASHNLKHSTSRYDEQEVKKSKEIIEKIINKKITGFRMPRLQPVDYQSLKNLGFVYDSSISPTYIPGRYNHYFKKRRVTKINNLFEIPISTAQIIRAPLSWIFFRFFGLTYSKIITKLCISNPGFVNLFFHPWEFNDLKNLKIPFYIRRNSGKKAIHMLEEYFTWCKKKNYKFLTIIEFLELYKK